MKICTVEMTDHGMGGGVYSSYNRSFMRERFTIDFDWRHLSVCIYRIRSSSTNIHLTAREGDFRLGPQWFSRGDNF